MTFVPVPNTGQSLADTRDQIRNNIGLLKTSLATNHYDLNVANQGKHIKVELPATAAPGSVASEIVLFGGAAGGRSAFFYQRDGLAPAIQMSGIDPLSSTNGYTVLPGSLLLQWGTTSPASSSSTQSVTFPIAFDSTPYNIQVTGYRSASSPGTTDCWVSTSNLTAAGFDIFNNGSHTFQFMWSAIGQKA